MQQLRATEIEMTPLIPRLVSAVNLSAQQDNPPLKQRNQQLSPQEPGSVEWVSLTPNQRDPLPSDEEMPVAPISSKKASEKVKFLDEVNQCYSSDSTKNLIADIPEDFQLDFADLTLMAGPWLGTGIWVFLKVCPQSVRTRVLNILSPIRNTIKSLRTVSQTTEMTGVLNRLPGPLKTGIGSATGLVAAALMTLLIHPKIKILEERLQQRTKLNQLLTKHLAQSTAIPQGLSELQLLQWLEDPTQFADIPRREINENDFADFNLKDAKQLGHYKKLAEIINGIYALSVLNSDLSFAGAKAVFSIPFVSLAANVVVGTAMVYNSYQIAQHHTEGLLLNSEQSCLSGKLALSKSSPATKEQLQTKLSSCEQRIKQHQNVNFNRFHLANASFKGFLEGAETVDLIVGIPVTALVLAHVVSATFPPLYFAVLGLTIVAGLYVCYQRYQQKKQDLEKPAQLKPPAKLAAPEEVELQCLPDKRGQAKPQSVCTAIVSAQKATDKTRLKDQDKLVTTIEPSKQKSATVTLAKQHENFVFAGLIKLALKFKQILGINSPANKEIELTTFSMVKENLIKTPPVTPVELTLTDKVVANTEKSSPQILSKDSEFSKVADVDELTSTQGLTDKADEDWIDTKSLPLIDNKFILDEELIEQEAQTNFEKDHNEISLAFKVPPVPATELSFAEKSVQDTGKMEFETSRKVLSEIGLFGSQSKTCNHVPRTFKDGKYLQTFATPCLSVAVC